MRSILLGLLVLLAIPLSANAAAWPDDWLGPADNKYVNLRLGVLYYSAVLDDLPDEKGVIPLPRGGTSPDGTALPKTKDGWLKRLGALQDEGTRQADMNLVRQQLSETAQFYWRNTRFNCALTFDYLNQDEGYAPVLRSSLAKADAPYYTPLLFAQDDKLRANPACDGLLQITVLYRYNAKTGQLERVHGGGGYTEGAVLPVRSALVRTNTQEPTSGLPTKKLCGYSWWIAPPVDNVCGSDWLLCHEFGHQLDSLFEQSGHPEMWFNHLARSEANIARFGEHFDCMSYILRRTPEADWQGLKWGEQRTFTDADHDNVPDRDDWLELAGLITDPDPAKADADGDGLSDFAEYMAMNGNVNGHGERLHPALHQVSPTDPDSDGDGILDGVDPLPYLPASPFIRSQTADDTYTFLNRENSPDKGIPLAYAITYQVNDMLGIEVNWGYFDEKYPDSEIRISLDLDDDGWFNGDDNYRIEIDPGGITRFVQNKASSDSEWPIEVPVDQKLAYFSNAYGPAVGYRSNCSLTLGWGGKLTGLQCKPGERIGINIGVRTKGEQWYYTIAEPNSLLPLTLR